MADAADRATDLAELEREHCTRRAQQDAMHMVGEYLCRQCGEVNDRRVAGFATCTDCVMGVD